MLLHLVLVTSVCHRFFNTPSSPLAVDGKNGLNTVSRNCHFVVTCWDLGGRDERLLCKTAQWNSEEQTTTLYLLISV